MEPYRHPSNPIDSTSKKDLKAHDPSSQAASLKFASSWILLTLTAAAAVGWATWNVKQDSMSSAPFRPAVVNITQVLIEDQARCFTHESRVQGLKLIDEAKYGQEALFSFASLTKGLCLSIGEVAQAVPQFQHHVLNLSMSKIDEINFRRANFQGPDDSWKHKSADEVSGDDLLKIKRSYTEFITTWQERFEIFQTPTPSLHKIAVDAGLHTGMQEDALEYHTKTELELNERERGGEILTFSDAWRMAQPYGLIHSDPEMVRELEKTAVALKDWIEVSKQLDDHLMLAVYEMDKLNLSLNRRVWDAFAADFHQKLGNHGDDVVKSFYDEIQANKDVELSSWEKKQ
ncbi:MAG: hypothetical protein Q9220_004666 [cf. Caloplaca sp. 1 TL-2023]